MTQWLLQQIRVHEPERSPDFALRSSINWMAALSHEVREEHGQTVQAQKASLQQAFGDVARRQSVARLDLVFEPLFASLNFATALVTAARRPASEPWESPSLIVTWYYAAYNAVRSMLAALGQPPADKHAKVIAMVGGSGLRTDLPHPLDMVARRLQGKHYEASLPSCVGVTHERRGAINAGFDGTRHTARQMLLEYLSGTTQYEAWRVEERVKQRGPWTDFRSKAARQERDRHLKTQIDFFHCAFRYRGKSNYRDAIFLSYGGRQTPAGLPYVQNMAVVARFLALVAMAYVERKLPTEMAGFRADLTAHYPGLTSFENEVQ